MTEHPTSRTLSLHVTRALSTDDSAFVHAHLDRCASCRTQVARLADAPPTSIVGVTAPITTARSVVTESTGPPMPNQIRRMSWDDCVALVVVRRVEPLRVLVQLAVPDGNTLADLSVGTSCAIGSEQIELDFLTVAVWFPMAAVDARVGDCVDARITAERICDAASFDEELLSVADDPDVDHDLLDHLADVVVTLSAADEWYSDLRPVDVSAQQWMDVGVTPGRALNLARGDAPNIDEEQALLAGGQAPGVPRRLWEEITTELSSPRVKALVRARASRSGRTELGVRRDLVADLRQPIAARTTTGGPLTIRARLDDLLA